ncbi:MAG: DUF58 domain-containing protein [Terrimicrobiaceae bacterium]
MTELFTAEFLGKLEGLHLLARQLSRGRQRAERRSVKRGAGLEFADYRGISPGDDIRAIDWKVFARSRHLLLKLFEEEEDLHVHLLLDSTASMGWGKPTKFDRARQIIGGLSYLALSNLDRAGVAPIGPKAQGVWAPGRGKARFLRLLRYLESLHTDPDPFVLAEGINRWLAGRPRRGLVIWVTDAWGSTLEDAFHALDRLRYARHEVGIVQIRHADECLAGELGEFELRDVEAGQTRSLIIDRAMAQEYQKKVSEYEHQLGDYCRRHGMAHLIADAGEDPLDVLRRTLFDGGFVR